MPRRIMQPQYILAVALLLTMLAVGIWDVIATATASPQNTVSNLIGTWSQEFPMLAVTVGVLIGHLFWPRSNRPL